MKDLTRGRNLCSENSGTLEWNLFFRHKFPMTLSSFAYTIPSVACCGHPLKMWPPRDMEHKLS